VTISMQLIKFWPSRAPGKGVCGEAKFLALPDYSQRPSKSYSHLQVGEGWKQTDTSFPIALHT